jgi:hypothetical protein
MVFTFLADGRALTDYKANCSVNRELMSRNKVSGGEYRHFLQKNGLALMQAEREKLMVLRNVRSE